MVSYRKRIKTSKNSHLNLSKSGLSMNFGEKGRNITVGSRGVFLNLGIPGSGISHRMNLSSSKSSKAETQDDGCIVFILIVLLPIAFFLFLAMVFQESFYLWIAGAYASLWLLRYLYVVVKYKLKDISASKRKNISRTKTNISKTESNSTIINNSSNINRSVDVSGLEGCPRFEEAARMVVTTQKCSTLDIQRRLGIRHTQAEQIMHLLEETGIVGPLDEEGNCKVLVSSLSELDQILG